MNREQGKRDFGAVLTELDGTFIRAFLGRVPSHVVMITISFIRGSGPWRGRGRWSTLLQ